MERSLGSFGAVLASLLVFCLVVPSIAQEKATKAECVARCKIAAELIQKIGEEEAVEKIIDKDGPFVWKDTYVFVFDGSGKILAHPFPKAIGKVLIDRKDSNGKLYFREFIKVANTSGEGWVSYTHPKVKGGPPAAKISYILKVPGKNAIVGAGIWK